MNQKQLMDQDGAQARAFIHKWEVTQKRADDLATSAGHILKKWRDSLTGDFYPRWLAEHGIAERTAQRVIRAVEDPEGFKAEREAQKDRDAASRADTASRAEKFAATRVAPGKHSRKPLTDAQKDLRAFAKTAAPEAAEQALELLEPLLLELKKGS